MTREEVLEGVDDPLWFVAYSHTLQWVGEAMHRWQWEWPVGKMPEVGVSPLVKASWEETGIELATSCMKLCWELPQGVYSEGGRGAQWPMQSPLWMTSPCGYPVSMPGTNLYGHLWWPCHGLPWRCNSMAIAMVRL